MLDQRLVTTPITASAGTRIGIDLVQVRRIAQSLEMFGERFVKRLFAPAERLDCTVDGRLDVRRLALRFAAKEATIKAFDLSAAGIRWSEIEMRCEAGADTSGRIRLHGRAAAAAALAGDCEIAVSSTLDDELACAIVVALPGSSAPIHA